MFQSPAEEIFMSVSVVFPSVFLLLTGNPFSIVFLVFLVFFLFPFSFFFFPWSWGDPIVGIAQQKRAGLWAIHLGVPLAVATEEEVGKDS